MDRRASGLAPRMDSVAPDPLVVFPIQDALDECKNGWCEESDTATILIAPDDLHKSDTSGGPPYGAGRTLGPESGPGIILRRDCIS